MTRLTDVDLAVLADWCEGVFAAAAPVRESLLRPSPHTLAFCEETGIIRTVRKLISVGCRYCPEDPHPCPVNMSSDGGLEYDCLRHGRVPLSPDQIAVLQFDRAALIRLIAAAAKLPLRDVRDFAEGRLVRIGLVTDFGLGTRAWCLGYADRLEGVNALNGVISAVAERLYEGPGLIITTSSRFIDVPLSGGYRFIALNEALVPTSNGFQLNATAISRRLGLRTQSNRPRGRPSAKNMTREIWEVESPKPTWPAGRTQQIEIIIDRWPKEGPDRPKDETLAGHLRDLEREESG